MNRHKTEIVHAAPVCPNHHVPRSIANGTMDSESWNSSWLHVWGSHYDTPPPITYDANQYGKLLQTYGNITPTQRKGNLHDSKKEGRTSYPQTIR